MNEASTTPHQIILDDRHQLHISGVTDVDSYDEETIVTQTPLGELIIKGTAMHINRLNIEAGDMAIDGQITSLEYHESRPQKGGHLRRWFR